MSCDGGLFLSLSNELDVLYVCKEQERVSRLVQPVAGTQQRSCFLPLSEGVSLATVAHWWRYLLVVMVLAWSKRSTISVLSAREILYTSSGKSKKTRRCQVVVWDLKTKNAGRGKGSAAL